MGDRQIDLIASVRRGTTAGLFCVLLSAQVDERWLDTAARTARAFDMAASASGATSSSSLLTRDRLTRYEETEPHMGTRVRLVFYAASQTQASRAARAAFARIAALNDILTDYQPTSELMQLSAQSGPHPLAGATVDQDATPTAAAAAAATAERPRPETATAAPTPTRVSEDLFRVLAAAQSLAERSHGAFDVTSGPLTRLWRGARRLSELPAASRIDEARARSGYRHLHLDAVARTATLDLAGMSLDVGGIAKGYAADAALAVLATEGITSALVSIGGDIVVSAPPPGQDAWSIDVASLDLPGAPRVPTLHLRDAAVSTAGDAEQWMTANGLRYSHILDPRTGWPMTGRSSTTVIARRGLQADGLDTTAAILGPDDGLRLVEETPGAAVFMTRLDENGRVRVYQSSRWPVPATMPAVSPANASADRESCATYAKITSSSASEH